MVVSERQPALLQQQQQQQQQQERQQRQAAEAENEAPPKQAVTAEALSEQGKEAAKDIAFGSFAGVVGKFVEYPFDTVKVRLQSQSISLGVQYAGPLDCLRQSWRQGGIASLYRGISAPLLGAAVETSSLFFSYRLAQEALQSTVYCSKDALPFPALLGCGAVSGAFTSLLLTPIELVKCKMQVPVDNTSAGTPRLGAGSIIASVYRHQGLLGFWHGQMGTLIRETGGSAAWFGSYEGTKILFTKAQQSKARATSPTNAASQSESVLPVWQRLTAGAAAGMSYNFIFYPADTIKSRMQTEDVSRITGGRQSFVAVGKALWKTDGLKGMYRGCGITVARAAPSSALIFTIYEALRREFG